MNMSSSILLLLLTLLCFFTSSILGANDNMNNTSGSGEEEIFSGDNDTSSIVMSSSLTTSSSSILDIPSSIVETTTMIMSSESSMLISSFPSSVFPSITTVDIFDSSMIDILSSSLISSPLPSTTLSIFSMTPTDELSSTIIDSSSIIFPSSTIDSLSSTVIPSSTIDSSSTIFPSSTIDSSSIIVSPFSSFITTTTTTSTVSIISSRPSSISSTLTSATTITSTSTTLIPTPTSDSDSTTIIILGSLFGASLAILAVVVIVLVFILLCKCVIKPKYSQDYELGQLADTLGDRTDSIPLLAITSNTNSKLGNLFEHIPPDEPSIDLSSLEAHIMRLDDDELARDEFTSLSQYNANFCNSISELPSNSIKNRYINILPFNETRVILNSTNKKDGSDYINANYIQGFNHSKEYIAAQGPLPQTIDDFWRMICETESETIVMVTNPVEAGNVKCEVYWPQESTTQQYGHIAVTTLKETIRPSFTVREFTICQAKKSSGSNLSPRTCVQYHYTAWPDMGVPNDCAVMIRFVKKIRSSLTNDKPIVVHCSAGVGRTGTFIALDILLQRMEVQDSVNIRKLIMQLRAQRCNMVQTPGQYVYIFKCLLYEYWYGETNIRREELDKHYEKLLEAFPYTEDSRLDKEFEGAQDIIMPDKNVMKAAYQNSDRNREDAGIPFDFNRVPLSMATNETNYINASFIGCLGRKAEYILTQHPLINTQRDFWRMILERHVETIVILGTVQEEDEYWPDCELMEWDDLTVTLIEKDVTNNGITAINIELESEVSEDYQNVTLYQVNDWPSDGTCPKDINIVLYLIRYIAEQNNGLIAIHTVPGSQECSGVFAVLYSLVFYLRDFGSVNVMDVVKRTLQQRPNCITTKEQYEFIYQVLVLSIAGAAES